MPCASINKPSADQNLVRAADAFYAASSWPRSVARDQDDVGMGQMWGVHLEGNRGIVGVRLSERLAVASLTLRSLPLRLSRRELAGLLGHWGHILRCRRPGFAVLQDVYLHGRVPIELGWDERCYLSRNTKLELFMLALLAPCLETDVRVPVCPVIGATDASEGRSGMCEAIMPLGTNIGFYDYCEGPGEHVFLKALRVPTEWEILRRSLHAIATVPLDCVSLGSHVFRIPQHINILQAHALLHYVSSPMGKTSLRDSNEFYWRLHSVARWRPNL